MTQATSAAHRMMLKLLNLTFLRISEVTQANVGARDVPYKRPRWRVNDGNAGIKSREIPLAISGKR